MIWLFDIDGTLIRSGGAGGLAMGRALAEVFGLPPETRGVTFSGCTDRGITADLFAAHEIEATEENRAVFSQCYLEHLRDALNERDGTVLHGAVEVLETLKAQSNVPGLLTGNMQAAARIKLEHFGLWDYFKFGGYGDDDADRNAVAAKALASASEYSNRKLESSDVLVIGDTPRDIHCARAHEMKVACVPTGEHSEQELSEYKPDFLFQTLHECLYLAKIGVRK